MKISKKPLASIALLAFAFAEDCVSQTTATGQGAKQTEEKCSISGTVTKLADGAPLKNATVQLEDNKAREHTIAAGTKADGRFELINVPAGRYTLIVKRDGYVTAKYGQMTPSDPGAALMLSPGQAKKDLLFKLIQTAVISGRVFDEDGEPLTGIRLTALTATSRSEQLEFEQLAGVSTDDLGGFRLYGLRPGKYYVSASGMRRENVIGDREFLDSSTQKAGEQAYVRTFYPGTTDVSRAAIVDVKAGEEVPGTDFSLKRVSVHRIRGKAQNLVAPDRTQETQLTLLPRPYRWQAGNGANAIVKDAEGTFELANVPAGSYTLSAYWMENGTPSSTFSGEQKIEVGESDLDGISISITRGATIQGRVIMDGKLSPQPDQFWITAVFTEYSLHSSATALVKPNLQFTLENVREGDAHIYVSDFCKDCYLKRITFGQTFEKEDVINVAKGANPPLEVTLSSKGARMQGSVVDKDGLPATGVWVAAIPDESRRAARQFYKSQTTDQYGKFDLHGLAPGEYKIFAWEQVEAGEWYNADFLKPFETKGEKIEVRDDDAKTVNLTVIPIKPAGNN